MTALPAQLQAYDPSVDPVHPDEAEVAQAITDALLGISEKTFADSGHALRAVHAKSHGLLDAQLEVLPDLPAALAQGVFATPGRYPALLRFSTIPGDLLDDKVSTPRGLAIKLLGVPGTRLEGSEDATTQDFITVNGPRFNASSPKQFLRTIKLVALTTDRAPRSKKVLSAFLRRLESVIESLGGQSAAIKSLGGHPFTHVLGETFFSQLPLRYGDYIAKLQIAPVSPGLLALKDQPVDPDTGPDALRAAVNTHFRAQGGIWEVRAQLCTNLADMPIDQPAREWDQELSPFIPVARLHAQPQTGWSLERSRVVDDGIAFNPWHGIAAHRPLGEMMRIRRLAYASSQRFRMRHNGKPMDEPTSLQLPD